MLEFLEKAVKKVEKISHLSGEELAYRVLPMFLLEIIRKYLRVSSTGLANIPKKGPCLIISNHSGFMGFDALMLAHEVHLKKKRLPRIIAHKLWFLRPEVSVPAQRLGLIPATFENGLTILERGDALILFPEGEEGNFKRTSERYRLRRFRRGFVRLALMTGAPIVPAVVIGAEETHITLSQLRWAKQVIGIIVPIPLNVIPLPVKWRIVFMKPIQLKKDPEKATDMAYVTKISRDIRKQLQKELHQQLKEREFVFL